MRGCPHFFSALGGDASGVWLRWCVEPTGLVGATAPTPSRSSQTIRLQPVSPLRSHDGHLVGLLELRIWCVGQETSKALLHSCRTEHS